MLSTKKQKRQLFIPPPPSFFPHIKNALSVNERGQNEEKKKRREKKYKARLVSATGSLVNRFPAKVGSL